MKRRLLNVVGILVLSFLLLTVVSKAAPTYVNIYGGGSPDSSKFDFVFVEYDPADILDLPAKAQANSDKLLGENGATGTTGWIVLKSAYLRTGYITTKASSPDSTGCWGAITSEGLANVDVCVLIDATNPSGQEYNSGSFFSNGFVYLLPSSDSYWVLAHELGNMAGLSDEYDSSGIQGIRYFPNLYDKPSNIRWRTGSTGSALIGSRPTEGPTGAATHVWRPYYSTVMRDSANGWVQQYSGDPLSAKGYDPLGADVVACKVKAKIGVGGFSSAVPIFNSITGLTASSMVSGILKIVAHPVAASGKSIKYVEFWTNAFGSSQCYMTIVTPDSNGDYVWYFDTTAFPEGIGYTLNVLAWDNQYDYTEVTVSPFSISNPSLNIPLIFEEALSNNPENDGHLMPGKDRVSEPVTFGVPIPDSANITSTSQLGLAASPMYQFKVLGRWPSGNIKWVLLDTQKSVSSGSYVMDYLVSGSGNRGTGVSVADNNTFFTVSTGVATFKVKKSNFNFIDEAVIGGKKIIAPGHLGGIELVSSADYATPYAYTLGTTNTINPDTIFSSVYDSTATAVVMPDESGPARVSIKATGSLRDSSGNRFMDYTCYLNFYANKSYVKTEVVLRHASLENGHAGNQKYRSFKSVTVKIPLTLANSSKIFEFAGPISIWNGTINSSALMYQAFQTAQYFDSTTSRDTNDFSDLRSVWYGSDYARAPWQATGSGTANIVEKGLLIKNGGTTINPLGSITDYSRGWGEVLDKDNRSLTVFPEYFSSYYPTSIEFGSDGTTKIGLFSDQNAKTDVRMAWGTHEVRTIWLDFHTAKGDNLGLEYRSEQPLSGRVSFNDFAKSGAYFGQTQWVDVNDFVQEFWNTNSPGNTMTYGYPTEGYQEYKITSQVPWRIRGTAGTYSIDYGAHSISQWFRSPPGSGYGGRMRQALAMAQGIAQNVVWRSDGFDWKDELSTSFVFGGNVNSINTFNRYYNYFIFNDLLAFDFEHNQFMMGIIGYFYTGDEELKDGMLDYSEAEARFNPVPGYSRGDFRLIRARSLLYEFSAQVGSTYDLLLTSMTTWMKTMLTSRYQHSPLIIGRDINRGFIPQSYLGTDLVHSFFTETLMAEDFYQAQRVMHDYGNKYLAEDMSDFLVGNAQFTYTEAYQVFNSTSIWGMKYDYLPFQPNAWNCINCDEDNCNAQSGIFTCESNYPASRAMISGYQAFSDRNYLERGRQLATAGGFFGHWGTGLQADTDPGATSELAYAFLYPYRSSIQVYNFLNVTIQDNGNDNYALSFIVPSNCTHIKIKYSNKPIVDWLGFNQASRSYAYDPASFTPWFSAWNYDYEPACAPAGTLQSVPFDVPSAIIAHNANRAWTSGQNEYVNYNPSDTFYFAVRYSGGQSSAASPAQDTTPPSLSNGQPVGSLPSGTILTTVSLKTNENANCKYSTNPGVSFSSMTNTFLITGGTSHSMTINSLQDGHNYTYYIRCQDSSLNPTIVDYPIVFSVGSGGNFHRADTNHDGCIEFSELMSFISRWQLSSKDVSITEVIDAVKLWKKGCP